MSGTFNLFANGNVVAFSGCQVKTSDTASTTLVFQGASTTWSGTGNLGCNITIAGAGTFTISGPVNFGTPPTVGFQTPQFLYTSAVTRITTGSTLGIVGTCSLSLNGIALNDVEFRHGGNYSITLTETLNIGGNLTNTSGTGGHTLVRNGTQVINLDGNLTILTGITTSTGVTVVLKGKTGTPSILSCANGAWCNVNVTIDSGAKTVQLSTISPFNFGENSNNTALAKRLKYISGVFVTAGSTIGLATSIIDIETQTLNNVNIYGLTSGTNVQLVKDLTITGNLYQGTYNFFIYGVSTITTATVGGIATTLTIQGGLTIGNYPPNGLGGTIKLRFTGSGTLTGAAICSNPIDFVSGTYTIGNFIYGLSGGVVNGPTMKWLGGTVTASGTLTSYSAKYDLANVELDNLATATTGGNGTTQYITIVASPILKVNGNFIANNGTSYGGTLINADLTTLAAQLDVYGNVNIGTGISYQTLGGTASLYMKGIGTITNIGGALTSSLGINTYFAGNVTIGKVVLTSGKKIEYVSGTVITDTNSLTVATGNFLNTITSGGKYWNDVAINASSTLIIDGDLTCRDFSSYAGGTSSLGGAGSKIIVTRNLSLTGLSNTNLTRYTPNPLDKIVMSDTGTWSGSQICAVDLDLNAPTKTITVTGQVGFSTRTLTWFPGTIMSAASSTLLTGTLATLDLGNQTWGNWTSGIGTYSFSSNANFNNVILGNGGNNNVAIIGNVAPRTVTIRGNYSASLTVGSISLGAGQNVVLSMTSTGTWSNTAGTITNLDVALTSGQRTLSGIVNWGGGKALTYAAGTLVSAGSTFVVNGSNTITVPKATAGSFNDVTLSASATITLNAQMGILGTLLLSSTSSNVTTFASSSTFGWDANNFTHGGGNTTCILNAGSIYNITGIFKILGDNDATRATLRSSKLSSFTGTANGSILTVAPSPAPTGSPIEIGMAISQATGVAPGTFGSILPDRPLINGGSALSWTLDPTYPISPQIGPIAMQAGQKAFLNLGLLGTTQIQFVIVKDIDSSGGLNIYAFGSSLDAPYNSQAELFRTINWNQLAPPESPVFIGWLSVT